MKRLRIDLAELAFAFERGSWEITYYLDSESGEVLMVGEESRRMLNHIYETYSDREQPVNLDAVLARRELVEWVKDDLKVAHRIDCGFGSRYFQVPESDSLEGYADLKAFIETVADRPFADSLWSAIQGKGVSRHFKEALAARPAEEQRWHAFKAEQVRLRIAEWLASIGIEAEART